MIGSDYVLEALNIYHTTDVSFRMFFSKEVNKINDANLKTLLEYS